MTDPMTDPAIKATAQMTVYFGTSSATLNGDVDKAWAAKVIAEVGQKCNDSLTGTAHVVPTE